MGAPKQKWTSEEEAALKAGIHKYGTGKWSTILRDPEFSAVLRLRSNVDLKDKWRNLNCIENGSGSRNRARVSTKNSPLFMVKQEDNEIAPPLMVEKATEILVATSPAGSSETSQNSGSRNEILRLDDLILEAIAKLKESPGSNQFAIAEYIEENCSAPPDFERSLAANLKNLTENGRLIKANNQYRIAPRTLSPLEESQLLPTNGANNPSELLANNYTMFQNETNPGRIRCENAAEAAAKAVAEAEAAIAEAELAAREAEEAEAEAEAAQCFADAALKSMSRQNIHVANRYLSYYDF